MARPTFRSASSSPPLSSSAQADCLPINVCLSLWCTLPPESSPSPYSQVASMSMRLQDVWKSYSPLERRNLMIYIAGIMFYKVGLEVLF
ncbi:hypothetical protein BT69DRAFT_1106558 [Atractiella rhizophila]|nr:hypothetical protein BT69DRAFT_1106558 [Atractiella rhizophila]